MATLHGTINHVWGDTAPLGPVADSSGNKVYGCYLSASFSGTYAQADDADLLTVPTVIRNFHRDARAVTLLQACVAAPGDEAGTPIGAGQCTISSTTISFPLTGGNLTTEHAGAALGTMTRDICFYVTYTATT